MLTLERRQQNIFIPPHPHSEGWCMRKPFTFTTLRNSLMFIVGCSSRAVVMQFLTYFRLAGHLILFFLASALHATVVSFREITSALDVLAAAAVSAAPLTTTVAIRPAHKAAAKRCMAILLSRWRFLSRLFAVS